MYLKRFLVPLTLLALMFALPASAKDRYINVSGQAEVTAWPDFMTIEVLISAQDKQASTAKANVDKAMRALLSITDALNIKEEQIESARLSSQPIYDWSNKKRQLIAEKVSRPVTITLRDLKQQSTLLHQLLQQKHIRLQHSESGFDNLDSLSLQATNLALLQAQKKAKRMAETLDMRLGKVLRIDEQTERFTPVRAQARMLSDSAKNSQTTPAPMLLQEQTINGRVQVRFQLK